jgi:hypothetical protein
MAMSPLVFVAPTQAPISTKGLKEEISNRFNITRSLIRPREAKFNRKQDKAKKYDTESRKVDEN